jgi:hypothetical protein
MVHIRACYAEKKKATERSPRVRERFFGIRFVQFTFLSERLLLCGVAILKGSDMD